MHKLISNRGSSIQSSVPESYILPPERRPSVVPPCKTIPVIDLQGLDQDPKDLVQQIIKASQEYGFFQVILCFFFLVSLELLCWSLLSEASLQSQNGRFRRLWAVHIGSTSTNQIVHFLAQRVNHSYKKIRLIGHF